MNFHVVFEPLDVQNVPQHQFNGLAVDPDKQVICGGCGQFGGRFKGLGVLVGGVAFLESFDGFEKT